LPIGYEYDPATRIVRIEISGEVREAELVDFAQKLASDESFAPGHRELVDLRELRHTEVTGPARRLVAGIFARTDRHADRTRVAVCAPDDLAFGLSRMYEAFRESSGLQLRVFRTLGEAERWLADGSESAAG
jgi:hypothetical protein